MDGESSMIVSGEGSRDPTPGGGKAVEDSHLYLQKWGLDKLRWKG